MIFFSLTQAPLPDPTLTPPNTPKRTRNRAETDPNGPIRTRKGPKRTRNGPKSSSLGWDGRGVVVREKENHYPNGPNGSSSQGYITQVLAGTDAGTGVRGGHVGVWGGFCCSAAQYGRGFRGRVEAHTDRNTQTHTGTYTWMLYLPCSDLPLKECPIQIRYFRLSWIKKGFHRLMSDSF